MPRRALTDLWASGLSQLRPELDGAVLFVDDWTAHALAWGVGLPALLECGVRCVVALGEELPPEAVSAVVVCAGYLPELHDALRRSLCATGSPLQRVAIFSSHSHAAHQLADLQPRGSDGTPAELFAHYEAVVTDWLCAAQGAAAAKPLVRIQQLALPAALSVLGASTFLLPAREASVDLPAGHGGAEAASDNEAEPAAGAADTADWSQVGPARRRELRRVASQLQQLLGALNVRPSLFALGRTAALVGRQVQYVPPDSHATGGASSSGGAGGPAAHAAPVDASVVLVERALDLVAPALLADHPLHQLLGPLLCPHAATAVPAAPAAEASAAEASAPTAAAGGGGAASVAAAARGAAVAEAAWGAEATAECTALLESLLSRRAQEVPQQLLKSLATLADEEGLEIELPARPSLPKLRALLDELQAAQPCALRHAPLLHMVCRTLRLLEEQQRHAPASAMHEQIVSHQKVLQHVAAEAPAAAMQSLLRLAMRAHLPAAEDKAGGGGGGGGGGGPSLGVPELVPLLAMLYSLLGCEAEAEAEAEQRLREALLQACLRDPDGGGLLPPHPGGEAGQGEERGGEGQGGEAERLAARRDALAPALRELFARLRGTAAARRGLGRSSQLLVSEGESDQGEAYRPLLRQLLGRALGGEDVAELQRLSGGALGSGLTGSLLSRGAQMLGVRAKSRVADHPLVCVFVVGGISLAEARELRQLFAQHPKHRLILGSTHLTSPASLRVQLLQGLHAPADAQ